MREEFCDDYLIINGAIFLSEIKTYRLRSCLCVYDVCEGNVMKRKSFVVTFDAFDPEIQALFG